MAHPRLPDPGDGTAADYFGGMIETYDSLIRRCVPRYEEMSRYLLDYIPGEPRRILELGCGTGNLTRRLAERYPGSEIHYVDASREMLDLTAHRLQCEGADPSRTIAVLGSFENIADLVEGPFDLVASCIALHHVVDKASMYAAIAGLLRSGGTFRFVDQLLGASPFNHEENQRIWLEFCREPGHCDETEIQSLLDHAKAHDHYTSLPDHFEMLRHAGFQSTDCVWRHCVWGIVTADLGRHSG